MTDDRLRVVIVDDEPLARAVVREYIKDHPGVEVVAECGNGFDAVKAVAERAPEDPGLADRLLSFAVDGLRVRPTTG